MVKILRKSEENHKAQFPKVSVFIGLNQYFIANSFQMLKMEFKFKYTILRTSVNPHSQFISAEVKKALRISWAQFQEKLRELRLRQNKGFLTKKCVWL